MKRLSSFVEGDNIEIDVNALASNTYVQSLRNQYKAELVVLFTGSEYGSTYGRAKDIGGAKENAYAIVDITEATNHRLTFAHEIGHLYGGRHNDDPYPGTAHGYIFTAGGNERRTLMAQTDGYFGSRIQYLSNPNVYVQGQPSGTAGYNNNAAKVSSMVNYVAGFYTDPGVLTVSVALPAPLSCASNGTATATAKCGYGGYTYKWYAGQYTGNSTGSWVYIGSGPTVNTYVPSSPTGFNSRPYKVIVTDGLGRVAIKHIYPVYKCFTNGTYDPASSKGVNRIIDNSLALYPNPARNSLNIELNRTAAGHANIELLDISGKKLRTLHKGELMRGTNTLTVDISGYAKGMYFIRLHSAGYNKTEKLIIQ